MRHFDVVPGRQDERREFVAALAEHDVGIFAERDFDCVQQIDGLLLSEICPTMKNQTKDYLI